METVLVILGIIVGVIVLVWLAVALVVTLTARKAFKMSETAFQNIFKSPDRSL